MNDIQVSLAKLETLCEPDSWREFTQGISSSLSFFKIYVLSKLSLCFYIASFQSPKEPIRTPVIHPNSYT